MSWPARRPGFMPVEAWKAAKALRDRSPPLLLAEAAALERLVGSAQMSKTWESLSLRAPSAGVSSWGLLLDVFVRSAPGVTFRPGLRGGLGEATALLEKISGRAAELAVMLDQLAELEINHDLDLPGVNLVSLLEAAGEGGLWNAPERYRLAQELEGVMPTLLHELAYATEDTGALPSSSRYAYALTGSGALVPEWVRFFDASYRDWNNHACRFVHGWTGEWWPLTDTELAGVAGAVLPHYPVVYREHVSKYLETAPADLDAYSPD